MPRTKRGSKAVNQGPKISEVDKRTRKHAVDKYIIELKKNCELKERELQNSINGILNRISLTKRQCEGLVAPRIGNATLNDINKGLVVAESTYYVTVSETTTSGILEKTNSTKSTTQSTRTRKYKRSSSVAAVDDEGYLTSEASDYSGSTRKSRAKTKQLKSTRVSRSLSKNIKSQASSAFNYSTPANRLPKTDFGYVTPKIKQNTPQVILRRPKEGEMAISMQGSPLLVNTIVSREANVNIPLEDGRTISIQPQRGIRMSELPDIDSPIRRQIEVLRDNLLKVCPLSE